MLALPRLTLNTITYFKAWTLKLTIPGNVITEIEIIFQPITRREDKLSSRMRIYYKIVEPTTRWSLESRAGNDAGVFRRPKGPAAAGCDVDDNVGFDATATVTFLPLARWMMPIPLLRNEHT